jgi:hypothetical protein
MPAVRVAQVSRIDELHQFIPLEESQPEGSLMQVSLAFAGDPGDVDRLASTLNQICLDSGVTPWPNSSLIASSQNGVINIRWQKGMAWWGLILAGLLSLVLPALLGAVLWIMLPESTRQLIESLTYLGAMMLIMLGFSKLIQPMIKEAA